MSVSSLFLFADSVCVFVKEGTFNFAHARCVGKIGGEIITSCSIAAVVVKHGAKLIYPRNLLYSEGPTFYLLGRGAGHHVGVLDVDGIMIA